MVGLGNIKINGSSAVNSPPKAPRKSLTFTAYDTIIPNASRWSGEASLWMNKNERNLVFESDDYQGGMFKTEEFNKLSHILHSSLHFSKTVTTTRK